MYNSLKLLLNTYNDVKNMYLDLDPEKYKVLQQNLNGSMVLFCALVLSRARPNKVNLLLLVNVLLWAFYKPGIIKLSINRCADGIYLD